MMWCWPTDMAGLQRARITDDPPGFVHRYIKNRRLAAAGYQWATTAAMTFPPTRVHYR
jgi:hypothetical protein